LSVNQLCDGSDIVIYKPSIRIFAAVCL
jgi:hypothetical protein